MKKKYDNCFVFRKIHYIWASAKSEALGVLPLKFLPMKKIFFMLVTAWVALSFFAACETDAEVQPITASANGTSVVLPDGLTPKIGYAEAVAIAQRGISMLESSASTRAAGRRVLDPANVKYVVTPATRAGDTADTLMYVFNFADSAGFALVATARESDQLLAVTEKGTYTPGVATGNPGFDLYMECAEQYLSTMSLGPGGGGLDPVGPGGYMYKLDYNDVEEKAGPFLTVKWGQDYPCNLFCFNDKGQECPAGCAAIAVAQIMTFYSYPTAISLTYADADIPSQILKWDAIKKHYKMYSCGYDCTEHKAIGRFVREIGKQLGMNYTPNSSGASPTKVPGCFSHFGYESNSLSSYNYSSAVTSLINNRLVYARGEDAEGGHGWVVDGYKKITRTIKIWKGLTSNGPWTLDSQEVRYYDYIHCNWGWDGDNDGYFNNGSFNVAAPFELDTGSSVREKYNFTKAIKMVTNIRPRK